MVKAISTTHPLDTSEVASKDIFHKNFKVNSFSLQKIVSRAIPYIFAKKETMNKIHQKDALS